MYGIEKILQGVRKNCPIYILDHWPAFLNDVNTLNGSDKGYYEKGDTGAGVLKLQKDLIFIGFNPTGGADGSFGPGTEAAVKSFQEQYNLTVDGIAGPQTLAKIKQLVDMKVAAQKRAEEAEKAAAEEAERKKAEAEAKAAAEEEARRKAEEAEKLKNLAPDGQHYKVISQFGAFRDKAGAEETKAAVAAELKKKGVHVNGQDPIVKIILE